MSRSFSALSPVAFNKSTSYRYKMLDGAQVASTIMVFLFSFLLTPTSLTLSLFSVILSSFILNWGLVLKFQFYFIS